MARRNDISREAERASLRSLAEARARRASVVDDGAAEALFDSTRLLHELRVHQVELEIQNEELQRSREALEDSVAHYAELYEQAPVGYLTLSRDGTVQQANLAAARLLGVDRVRLIERRLSSLVVDPAELAALLEAAWRSVGRSSGEVRLRAGETAGGATSVLLTLAVAAGRDHCRAVLVDVSERFRTEQRLADSGRMEAVGQLAGGVAHDFNNLLTVILGHLDFALDAVRDEGPLREDLLNVQKASRMAAELTQQLLAFGRRQVQNPVVVDANELVRSFEPILRRMLSEDIELVLDLVEDSARIVIDPVHFQQVLLNLSANARDAMRGGGRLSISTGFVDAGRAVRLSVRDTGIGMDAATAARIFEPFFTTKPKGRGTGLGLATAYGIVKQCGGEISVESAPGEGARFDIDLPRADVTPPEVAPAGAGSPHLPADHSARETLLVVEDQRAVRELARRVLSSAGYRVLVADSGAEALAQCGQHDQPIHLVLSDVIMPGMSGAEFVARLRKTRPAIRVLYMSGYPEDEFDARGVPGAIAPSVHFLGKPFTGDALKAAVRAVLDAAPKTDGAA